MAKGEIPPPQDGYAVHEEMITGDRQQSVDQACQ
jgi:hypothetical protein